MGIKTHIAIAIEVAGPSYVEQWEDGPRTNYDYYAQATTGDGRTYTHNRAFRWNERQKLRLLLDRVIAVGEIDLDHWWEGTVWDAYKEPQTYEEERAEYEEKIANGTYYTFPAHYG